jgi:hypothetical protein
MRIQRGPREVFRCLPFLSNVCSTAYPPDGGPGFIILGGRGDDYAQAAGGEGVFTAEFGPHSPREATSRCDLPRTLR